MFIAAATTAKASAVPTPRQFEDWLQKRPLLPIEDGPPLIVSESFSRSLPLPTESCDNCKRLWIECDLFKLIDEVN